jgi:hypothetical protein
VAGAEQSGGAAGDPVGQVGGVFGGGVGGRVAEAALVEVQAARRFQPGPLGAKFRRGGRGGDRLDVLGEVQAAGPGQQNVRPCQGELRRVAGHRGDGGVAVAEVQLPGGDVDGGRADHRGQFGGAVAAAGGLGAAPLTGPGSGLAGSGLAVSGQDAHGSSG